jgi:hypothetical protein
MQNQVQSLIDTLRELRRREHSYRRGAEGERLVAEQALRVIVDLGSDDWHILADRQWPGTRRANVDLLLVGPPGVFVLDAKNWRKCAAGDQRQILLALRARLAEVLSGQLPSVRDATSLTRHFRAVCEELAALDAAAAGDAGAGAAPGAGAAGAAPVGAAVPDESFDAASV